MTPPDARKRLRLRRIRITGWTSLTALLVTIVSFLTWFHIVLPADRDATLDVFRDDRVVFTTGNDTLVLTPASGQSHQGILFFPGAKVDPYSYLYPFVDVVAEGATLVVMEPLFNMALFDARDLEALTSPYPEINQWTLVGHSLGGVRACMLAEDPQVSNLVLLASFCANDLSKAELTVLQVAGDRDTLIEESARADAEALLPPNSAELITLAGANHASFGTYGPQPGDALATLSHEDMRDAITAIFREQILID